MKHRHFFTVAFAAAFLLCPAFRAHAQQPPPIPPQPPSAPAPAVESVVSRAVVHPRADLEVTYTLSATAPLDSKLTGQKLRLEVAENGVRDVTQDDGKVIQQKGRFSRSISINTGKYKTLGQLHAIVIGIFRQFLRGAAPNQDLGKIGDAKYGGELHFVAQSPERLRFDYIPSKAKPEDAVRFTRADIEAFAGMLK